MSVKVFQLVPGATQVAYRPQDMFHIYGWEGGIDIQPQLGRVAYKQLGGLAIFTSREQGGAAKLFLMLMLEGRPRPILADSAKVRFNDFPIQAAPSAAQNMRQLGRLLCHQAVDVIVDQATLDFLEGQPPPLFEKEILQLTTAFGCLLMPQNAPALAPSAPQKAPSAPEEASRSSMNPFIVPPAAPFAGPSSVPAAPQPSAAPRDRAPEALSIGDEDLISLAPIVEPAPSKVEEEGDVYQGDVYQGDSARPANPYARPDAGRTRGDAKSASLISSITYPLRGSALVTWILLSLGPIVMILTLITGCIPIVIGILLAFASAGVQFEIIRQTADGSDTMRGSPDLFDVMSRLREILATWLVGLVPMLALSVASSLLSSVHESAGAVGAVVAGTLFLPVVLICLFIWQIALGSTAVYGFWSFTVRVDLHLIALVKCWKAALVFMFRVFLLALVGGVTLLILSSVPVVRVAAFVVAVFSPIYIFLASAHFIGLFFRENQEALEQVYLLR
jgi:hypothetical protein